MKELIIENWLVIILAVSLLLSFVRIIYLSKANKKMCRYFIGLQSTDSLKDLSSYIRITLADIDALKLRGEPIPQEIKAYAVKSGFYKRIADIIDSAIKKRKKL